MKTLHQEFVISWSIFHLQLGKMKKLLEINLNLGNFTDQQIKQCFFAKSIDKKHKEPSDSTAVSF